MKQSAVTNHFSCEHCGRSFVRESTIARHLCEQKRRWDEQTRPANRIAYQAWKKFYEQFQPSKRDKDYRAFIASSYYGGFVKFGTYCVDARVVNPIAYLDWSLAEKIALDNWTSDRNYGRYLVEYLQLENNLDAVRRSIETLLKIAEDQNIRLEDVLRLYSTNKVCHLITQGHISAWLLFNCGAGTGFLEKLNSDQLGMIYEYINIDKWKIKFMRDQSSVDEVKNLLREAGL